jgi:predicted NBD/HSP70 family sugar kinase
MSVAEMVAPSAVATVSANPALLTVGIDVGGTKTACVVTDADDRVLMREVEPTDAQRLAAQLDALIRRAVDHVADEGAGSIEAVGIALPGFVDPRTGSVGLAVNLGGERMALGPMLEKSVGLPCFVEHDARAAASWLSHTTALREEREGAGNDLVYLSVGTGISAGIVLHGQVLRGRNGLAGEVGHTFGSEDGNPCPCGMTGCVEVAAAGPAIARMAREAIAQERSTSLPARPTAADVFRAAAEGDAVAAEIADAVGVRLARLIRTLVLTLGVNHIIVGGGVAAAGNGLLDRILAAVARERAASPLVEAAFAESIIELLSPELEAGARGAAAIARRRVADSRREGVGD